MATWGAGQRITAGKLMDLSAYAALPDQDTVSASTVTWGNTSVDIANPGVDVAVCAWLTGHAYTAGAGKKTLNYAVEISTDGGTNYSSSVTNNITVEPSGVSGVERNTVAQVFRAQALPTGTIRVRVRISSTGGTDILVRAGSVLVTVVGV